MIKKIASGKVREIYGVDSDKLLIVTTDRISAFDVILPTPIPGKGKILNQLALFWFEKTSRIIKNHIISAKTKDFPPEFQSSEYEGRSVLVKRLKIIPIECVVRGYITGSGWDSYLRTGTVCHIPLPEGLKESEKLKKPIFTPTTKAAEGHDLPISFEEMVAVIGNQALAEKIRKVSLDLYTYCAEYAKEKGIIIADTKFEFGLDEEGELLLADEILTPDSSRFWDGKTYEPGRGQKSYDKQFVRDWLKANHFDGVIPPPDLPEAVVAETVKKYQEAFHLLTDK